MNLIERAFWSHDEADRAKRFANNKQLKAAIEIANKVISSWSDNPGFLERQTRKLSIDNLLSDLKKKVKYWETQVQKAEHLAQQAEQALANNNSDPWDTTKLERAIYLYDQSLSLMDNLDCKSNKVICQTKLQQKHEFQQYFKEGKEKSNKRYYKKGLEKFFKAQFLFITKTLSKEIINCRENLFYEKQYEKAYNQAKQLTKKGDFQNAITHFKPTYNSFPRQDGKEFLRKLQEVVDAKKTYQKGLMSEKQKNWQQAKQYYSQARQQLPDLNETCSTRLALMAIKTQQWSTALEELNYLPEEKANYLRGYIYAHQGEYQAAHQQWKFLSHPHIQAELEKLRVLVRREKLTLMQKIESALDQETLEQAETLSQKFLQEYGTDPTIEHNLYQHIQPRITNSAWENQTWQKLTKYTENQFVEQQNLSSLHNWAVATYYQAQTNPETMEDWITAWCAAIANLRQDPALKDIPWLGSEEINFDQLLKDLQKLLEDAIDEFKETNLEWYFNLRDKYRKDLAALDNCFTINGLNITPNCYQRHQDKFQEIKFPATVYGALYTAWGEAVAACLEGDIKRTFTITPSFTSDNLAEKYGRIYVAYKQGIYYLQDHDWQSAKSPLNLAKETIRKTSEWQEEIDRLCEAIRRKINYEEALNFSEFWYKLLDSVPARNYYVEQQVDKIRNQLVEQTISESKAKNELQQLKRIDAQNLALSELIRDINRVQEGRKIYQLLQDKKIEEAVRRARSCDDERLRYQVAEICIDVLLEGAEKNTLYREDIIDLARWAYSLCPNEPNFQEVYKQLGFL